MDSFIIPSLQYFLVVIMMIATNSRAHKRGKERGVWKNLKGGGGECRLRGNGTTESVTCCTMCKRG